MRNEAPGPDRGALGSRIPVRGRTLRGDHRLLRRGGNLEGMAVIVKIQTRDGNGKYAAANPGDFCVAAFTHIGDIWGWPFLIYWLGRWCVLQSERECGNATSADLWYARYQALRSIK